MTVTPTVSFIIPVRDDALRLRRCLQSISSSNYPRERLEIVVADNGSTDGSDVVARRAGAKVLSLPGLRVSELRNRAAAAAAGSVLAFVDADHEIDPGWVSSAVRVLLDPEIGAAGAPYHSPAHATWVQRLYDARRQHAAGPHEVHSLGTGNMAVSRTAFDAVSGFDGALETWEDVDLCCRLRARGFRLISDERLRNVHHGDPLTLRALFVGELWHGKDMLRVSCRRPLSRSLLFNAVRTLTTLIALVSLTVGLVARFTTRSSAGSVLGFTAGAAIALVMAVQAGRMLRNLKPITACDVIGASVVALTLELGRALAPLVQISYLRRRAIVSRAPEERESPPG